MSLMPNWQADKFWLWSIDVYQQAQVKQACLHLQDSYDCNVNLILLCMYLQSLNCRLSVQDCQILIKTIRPSEQNLKAHRRERRQIKSVDNVRYKRFLAQELVLEKQQQVEIIECLNHLNVAVATEPPEQINVFSYLQALELDSQVQEQEYIYLFEH